MTGGHRGSTQVGLGDVRQHVGVLYAFGRGVAVWLPLLLLSAPGELVYWQYIAVTITGWSVTPTSGSGFRGSCTACL